MRTRVIAAISLAASLSALAVSPASAATSVSAVVLHKSEVPKGFSLTSQFLSNAQMAKATGISKTLFDQHGRITGFKETFSTGKTTGFFEIVSHAYQYKTTAGAVWDWQQSSASDRTHGRKPTTVPKIGDHSAGFSLSQKNGSFTYVAYNIDFQRGTTDMIAAVIGVRGSVSMKQVVRYAQIMASRAH